MRLEPAIVFKGRGRNDAKRNGRFPAGRHQDLRSGHSRVQALRGVDLEVRIGELLMLVGPSGCGKTTLISVMAGILDHDEGEFVVFGHDLEAMARAEKTRFRGANIGFVFQAFNLLPTLTATENVAIPLLIHGSRRAAALAGRGDAGPWGSGTSWRPFPRSSRAGSSSGWPSPGPWCTTRGSSSATSRPAPWTTTRAGW